MGQKEFEQMVSFLKEKNVVFEVLEHEPVFTSEQAAKVRGADLSCGVKALLFKSDSGKFVLVCLPGNKKVDAKKLAFSLNEKKFSLASPQEVLEKTGCEIGSVSPLCAIFGVICFFDKLVFDFPVVEFNVGLHTHSVRLSSSELKRVLNPSILGFSI